MLLCTSKHRSKRRHFGLPARRRGITSAGTSNPSPTFQAPACLERPCKVEWGGKGGATVRPTRDGGGVEVRWAPLQCSGVLPRDQPSPTGALGGMTFRIEAKDTCGNGKWYTVAETVGTIQTNIAQVPSGVLPRGLEAQLRVVALNVCKLESEPSDPSAVIKVVKDPPAPTATFDGATVTWEPRPVEGTPRQNEQMAGANILVYVPRRAMPCPLGRGATCQHRDRSAMDTGVGLNRVRRWTHWCCPRYQVLTMGANPPDTIVDVLLDAKGIPVNDVNARSKVLDRQTAAQAGLVPGTMYRVAVQVKNSVLPSDPSNKTAPKLMKCYAGEIASQPVTADTTQVTCLSCGSGDILDAPARKCVPATRRQQDAVAAGAFDATNSSYVAVAPEASRCTDRRSRRRPLGPMLPWFVCGHALAGTAPAATFVW